MGEMADYVIGCGFEDLDGGYWDNEEFDDPLMYSSKEPFYPIRLDRGPGICPKCGAQLIEKNGRYGLFWGCPQFPRCKYARPYR